MSYTLAGQELIDGVYYKREDFFNIYVQDSSLAPASLLMWGNNFNGQLGNGTDKNCNSIPAQVAFGGFNWKQVSCGKTYTMAVKSNGSLWSWGENNKGQLGINNTISSLTPAQVGTDLTWKQVSCGFYFGLALKTNNSLWAWGENSVGYLADGTIEHRSSPVQVGTGTDWKEISAGYCHCAAIKNDGSLWLWGSGSSGVFGTNSEESHSSPIQTLLGGTDWKQVGCGWSYTVALKIDGTLWTWGDNWGGQLGDNTLDLRSTPAQTILGGTNWSSISVGDDQSAAIKTDGSLWMWGSGWGGGLGNSDGSDVSSPIQVGSDMDWVVVRCNDYWTIAAKANKTLWAWGYNASFNLGTGNDIYRSSPVQILSSITNWVDIAKSNNYHTGLILLPE